MAQGLEGGEMKIFIKLMKTISVDVNPTDTIDALKAKIYSNEGVRIGQQQLYFDGNHLIDSTKSLSHYNISSNSKLDLYISDGMRIHVKIPSISKDLLLDVKKTDTIATIKTMIENISGISSTRQTLSLSGVELNHTQVLGSCGAINGSTLHVFVSPKEEMCISVHIAKDRTVDLQVKRWYSVGDVKLIIERMEGLSANDQRLSFDGNFLEDSVTLWECNKKDGSILNLKMPPIQIFVKSSNNRTITLIMFLTDTIEHVMNIIEGKLSYTLKNHYLCYNGCVLKVENTIGFYNIKNDSTIDLRVRLSSYLTKYEETDDIN